MIKAIRHILLLIYISCILVGCGEHTSPSVVEESISLDVTEQSVEEDDNASSQLYDMEYENVGNNAITIREGATLEVHFIDVGQGDSILVKQGQHSMLIDAGNNDKGSAIWAYLLKQNIETLDYAICTHPDADHIGGMDVILYKFDCENVFMPVCEHDTETYADVIRTIGQREKKVTVPKRGETYALGEAQFQILTDTDKKYGDNNNDYSIAIRLIFGATSFLFTGDAEKEAEQDMMSSGLTLESDVYKVAHHGAHWSSAETFLATVNPTYAVISCGEENSYGHPRAEVLNNLRNMGVKVFRTDEQGSIVAISDGTDITFNCSPSTTWKAGEPTGSGVTVSIEDGDKETSDSQKNEEETGQTCTESWKYILNTRSMKIHYPHCSSVDQMSEKNKGYSNLSKEELIEQGYESCGNCKP